MRKRPIIIAIFGIVGAVLLPLFSIFGPIAIKDIATLSAVLTALTLVYLTLLGSSVLQVVDQISLRLGELPTVEPITEDQWYPRFAEAIRTAEMRVKISYLSVRSPLDIREKPAAEYYRHLPTEIRKRRGIEFKRIVRAVPQMSAWIEQMVRDMEGVGNFSLACLPGTDPKEDSIDTVSVQCVDKDRIFLVAVGEQREARDPRDLFVRSPDFGRVWNAYYDRVWARSLLVVDRGVVNTENLVEVRAIIGGAAGNGQSRNPSP